jgi:hypothetical protein
MSVLHKRPNVRLLQRLLDEPQLPQRVQALAPSALAKLIDEVGLEDAGELVALATPEQLLGVFDEDVWGSIGPGVDESLDPQRFAMWLEVMLEAGPAFVARKVADLPEELVIAALNELLLTIDVDALGPHVEDPELLNKALDATQYFELDRYLVVWRGDDGWEAMLSLLVELDASDPDLRERLLATCCETSMERIENDGLHNVLTRAESLAHDAAAERAERRARAGHVAPTDATSFLRLARTTPLRKIISSGRDPVVRAYFREIEMPRVSSEALPAQVEPLAALPVGQSTAAASHPLRDALVSLRQVDPPAFSERMEELAFLLNVVVAGCGIDDRRLRSAEAADVVLAVCEIGLAHLGGPAALEGQGADKLFRIGWHLLGHGLRADAWSDIAPATCELLLGLQLA